MDDQSFPYGTYFLYLIEKTEIFLFDSIYQLAKNFHNCLKKVHIIRKQFTLQQW